MNTNTAIMADSGRNASRARRAQLVLGKAGLPPAAERSRSGARSATVASSAAPAVMPQPLTPAASAATAVPTAAPAASPAAPAAYGAMRGGRDTSRARRAALVLGKAGLQQLNTQTGSNNAANTSEPAAAANAAPVQAPGNSLAVASRQMAQALRAARAKNGRGDAPPARPSGRVRNPVPLNYAPKVAASETYAGGQVTGVRIGRGMNVTGDERGAAVQVTGSQYIGKETGFQPREGGIKVGVSRTASGLTVTGTQVRSKISITGDEYNCGVRITGEADQDIADDLLQRRESGAYTAMQFQRQHNPHGHTVFGINLGRSAGAVGSRERSRERALEFTEDGLPISGTAVGRSVNVTGDESGTCRPVTGDQYLMPAARQPLCETDNAVRAGGMPTGNGRRDPVTGAKVKESETWARQRITGVEVEHNERVTGDEYGVCNTITGTPYVGPAPYEAVCPTGAPALPQPTAGGRVTGDTPRHVDRVTGTHRGCDRSITGTPYYREALADDRGEDALARINARFTVRSPQREAQLRADVGAVQAPTAAGRITGSFAVGDGKITGNQEFLFSPRPKGERNADKSRITGEGRSEGPAITGGAWDSKSNVTGTEDYIAAERNPSERGGKPHAFAGAGLFKGKGEHRAPTHHVTGMVGWSPKTAARVTLSGGAQG